MEVIAEWPGTVREIIVAVGDIVEEGTDLITIESMKMETSVAAPTAGRVAAIHVQPEDVIAEGALLVTLE